MNWKITGRFIVTVVSVAIIVIVINIIGGAILIFNGSRNNIGITKGISYPSAEDFTREFQEYLIENNNKIYINNNGEKILREKEAWIQVLDEEGNELKLDEVNLEEICKEDIEATLNITGVEVEKVKWIEIGPYKTKNDNPIVFKIE